MRHLPRRADEAYSPTRRPIWRFGFGDLIGRMQKRCALMQSLLHARKAVFMAAVRGRPSGLPVFRSRFANLRTAVTHSFGDD